MGGEWQGEKLGTLSDVGFFSLGRGKAFSTVEGGIILTSDDQLAEQLAKQLEALPDYSMLGIFKLFLYTVILNLLLHPMLFWIPKGLPFLKLGETIFDPDFEIKRMSSFQAGLSKNWPEKLRFFRQERQSNTKKLSSILNTEACKFFFSRENNTPDIIRFPVEVEDKKFRAGILESGTRTGSGVSIAYPDALCDVVELAGMFENQKFPAAKKHARDLITLPVHVFVSNNDLDRVTLDLRGANVA